MPTTKPDSDRAKLLLIGAGPGARDLITVRGRNALASADVVLYDALTNPLMLEYAPPYADRIYVGKRGGVKSIDQETIHELILRLVNEEHRIVARLKGGDPFVFGRGYEEMIFALEHDVTVEVIPGLTSGLAAPALSGIPVTLRDVSRAVTFVTATTSDDILSDELISSIGRIGTVVVFMGLRKLNLIANEYQVRGLGSTPVAVIQEGSLSTEQTVIGEMHNIERLTKEADVEPPALIVIGDVVRYSQPNALKALQNVAK